MMKRLIRALEGFSIGEYIKYHKKKFRLRKFKNAKDLFTNIYSSNAWDDGESVSGPGSTLEYTENIRKEMPGLISSLGVRTILDAPCGDYNWFRFVERGEDLKYIGGDIVGPLIVDNEKKYGNKNTAFIQLDVTKDPLPSADLWLCRDVFIHLSTEDIFLALENYLKSDIKYLLTSDYPNCNKNTNIPTGSGRHVNLQLPPFNFCKPDISIDDWIEGHAVRTLSLWKKEDLAHILS